MADEGLRQVNTWIENNTKNLSSDQLLDIFERLTIALWRRANLTISTVTLKAVLERVIERSSERFLQFAVLEVARGP